MVLEQVEVGGDHGEEIARASGTDPPSAPSGDACASPRSTNQPAGAPSPCADEVAVGEQAREARLVRAQRDGVLRHHVGAVDEVGDAAEALGLALRDQARLGGVEPLELGVLPRIEAHHRLEREARPAPSRCVRCAVVDASTRPRRARARRSTTDSELEVVAVEHQRRAASSPCAGLRATFSVACTVACAVRDVDVERDASRSGTRAACSP